MFSCVLDGVAASSVLISTGGSDSRFLSDEQVWYSLSSTNLCLVSPLSGCLSESSNAPLLCEQVQYCMKGT